MVPVAKPSRIFHDMCAYWLTSRARSKAEAQGPPAKRPPSPAPLRQLAHSLDTQAALQRHPSSYFAVDAFSPEICPWGRRAPTFCKARLKKSTSMVLLAYNRLRFVIRLQSINFRVRKDGGLISSNRSRQL